MKQMADDSAAAAVRADGRRAPATLALRVDHAAFLRGSTEPGETCEVSGSDRSR